MNFEVNGIPYFFTFDVSQAQWCLLTPSARGIEQVEIHNDGSLPAAPWNEDEPHDPRPSGGLN